MPTYKSLQKSTRLKMALGETGIRGPRDHAGPRRPARMAAPKTKKKTKKK